MLFIILLMRVSIGFKFHTPNTMAGSISNFLLISRPVLREGSPLPVIILFKLPMLSPSIAANDFFVSSWGFVATDFQQLVNTMKCCLILFFVFYPCHSSKCFLYLLFCHILHVFQRISYFQRLMFLFFFHTNVLF